MNIADIINIAVEVISLVILELLRRNNKATDWIKNRIGKVDQRIQNNREMNYYHIEELIEQVKLINANCTEKCNCQCKKEE